MFRTGNQPGLDCRLPKGNEQYPNDLESRFLFWQSGLRMGFFWRVWLITPAFPVRLREAGWLRASRLFPWRTVLAARAAFERRRVECRRRFLRVRLLCPSLQRSGSLSLLA